MASEPGERAAGYHRRRLAALVVTHFVAIAALAWLARRFWPPMIWHELQLPLYVSLLFCQMGLLAFWTGLGANPFWLRSLGSLLALCGLWLLTGWATDGFLWDYAILVAAPTVTAAALLQGGRWIGWALMHDLSPSPSRRELQFGVRHLMLFTLAVAVVLGIGRWVGFERWRFPPSLWWIIPVFSAAIVLVTLVSIWATLGQPRWFVRGGATLIAGLAVGWGLDRLVGEPLVWFYTLAIPTMTIWLAVSLLVVRSCGYRLVRVRRTRDPSTQSLPPN